MELLIFSLVPCAFSLPRSTLSVPLVGAQDASKGERENRTRPPLYRSAFIFFHSHDEKRTEGSSKQRVPISAR